MRRRPSAHADFATNPLLHVSPGEKWSRNFQSQSIGPKVQSLALSDLAPVPRAMLVPHGAGDRAAKGTEFAPRPVVAAPMAEKLGKPEKLVKPRRSWLGRMFGRA